MLHRSFKPAKCKTALKLATSRIKLMKNKKENHLKQLKRELAQLLESGQDQTARIRVEHVVREEKTIAAYDLIDIYCELLVARLPIIDSQKNCPIDLKEAVTSVVFAAPRCSDIQELQDVRKQFTAKYGKEFVNCALELRPECGVSRILVEKLSANAPDGQTKLKILAEIAQEHNIEWDPKSFGAKESKPYDDLLNGPNKFEKASQMHKEPPIVQSPYVHVPQVHDEKHEIPVKYEQKFHSSSSQNFSSSDFNGSQSTSPPPQPPLRPSGTDYERTEIRQTYSREENNFSTGRENWNMEFTDATAAAQAAAESAERASMAARAAAELSRRDKFTKKYSSNSNKSNIDDSINNNPRKYNSSPSEKIVKDTEDNSPQDRNRMPSMRTEEVHGFYKDDHSSAKRFGQSASSRSGTASASFDNKRPMNIHGFDKYSRKNSFEEEALKPENNASFSRMNVNKHSSGEDRNSYHRSSSSDDGDDNIKSPSHQNIVFDDYKDPFENNNSRIESIEKDDIGTVAPVFDSYISDDDITKFDKPTQYDEQESNFYSPSITRKPSNHFAKYTSGSSKKPLSASRISEELFSTPHFDENSPKSSNSAHLEDTVPATFDDSSGPSSDSEAESEKSSFRGNLDPAIRSYKENHLFKNSNSLGEDQSRINFDYDDVSSTHSSSPRRNSKVSSNEITNRISPQPSRLSHVVEVRDTDDTYTSLSSNSRKNEMFDRSRLESGQDSKFPILTGGLRNKGYKAPPYRKSPSNDLISSKGATEDSPIYTQNNLASPRVGSNSSSFSEGQKEKEKEKENSSYRTRVKKYELGTDDAEEELSQQNLRTRVKKNDVNKDDFEEEITKPKFANKQERKEEYTKIEEIRSSRTRVEKYDLGTDDAEELPQPNLRTRVRNNDLNINRLKEEVPKPELANKQERKEKYIRVEENPSSSRPRVKKYDLGTNDAEEKLPQQNLRTRVNNNDLNMDGFEEELPKQKLANKQERKEEYAKSKFSAPSGYFDESSEEDLPKRPSPIKKRLESGSSRRTKTNPNSETNSRSKMKPVVSENRDKARARPEKYSSSRPETEEKLKPSLMEKPSSPMKTAALSRGREEGPSRESSLKKASHVHPKLPDYESIAAHMQSLRENRG